MKILFQGDSITDAGRSRECDEYVGTGYPLLVKSRLGFEEPNDYEFVNRGISGNRIVDLYARIKADIINVKPDVMSILIGVNDVWHELSENPNGVDADKFFKIYSMLIEEVKEALPDIKIMIFEPYVLKGTATEANWDYFDKEVKLRSEMAKKVAEKFDLPFVPLQAGFDELSKKAPCGHWAGDGVHPQPAGHQFIADEWIKTFKEMVK